MLQVIIHNISIFYFQKEINVNINILIIIEQLQYIINGVKKLKIINEKRSYYMTIDHVIKKKKNFLKSRTHHFLVKKLKISV